MFLATRKSTLDATETIASHRDFRLHIEQRWICRRLVVHKGVRVVLQELRPDEKIDWGILGCEVEPSATCIPTLPQPCDFGPLVGSEALACQDRMDYGRGLKRSQVAVSSEPRGNEVDSGTRVLNYPCVLYQTVSRIVDPRPFVLNPA
jgi:hypothetical protein